MSEVFSITIDFNKDAPKPSRVFKAMGELIETFEAFDNILVKSLDNKIDTVLVIEDIQKGSLRTILKNIVKGVPDEAIENLDIKKIIGHYLLKAKYIILNKLENKVTITDSETIETIEYELLEEAKKSGVDKLPFYVPVTKTMITKGIEKITNSIDELDKQDSVVYESNEGSATFNLDFHIESGQLEDLITKETITSTAKLILKVKKPDYLGESQWTFKHGEHPINAKIEHIDWLKKFQNGDIELRPQDSLVCIVETTVKYDDDFEVISTVHLIKEVIQIHHKNHNNNQSELDLK